MAGTGGVLMGTNYAGVHTDGPLGAFVPIGATAQLAPISVKCMIAKEKLHWRPHQCKPRLGK